MTLIVLPRGQYAEKGLVLNLPSNVQTIATQLPKSTQNVDILLIKYMHNQDLNVANDNLKHFASASKIALALQWLKENNKHYVDLFINEIDSLNQPSYMHNISDVMFDLEPFATTPSDSTLPDTNITKYLKTGSIDVPHINAKPVNVYDLECGEEMAFSWLFPRGAYGYNFELALQNTDYDNARQTRNFMDNMRRDPLMTAIHFEHRFKSLMKHIIKSGPEPLVQVEQYNQIELKKLKSSIFIVKALHYFNSSDQNALGEVPDEFIPSSDSDAGGLVETDQDVIIPPLPEESPKDGQNLSLHSAIKSPSKSVVTGNIVKVSPIKHVQEGTLPVKSIILKDKTATAKICLFGKNAELDYQKWNMVEVSAVYPKAYYNVTQLTSTSTTKCQFLPPDEEIELLNGDENNKWKVDPDFKKQTADEEQHIQLTDIVGVDLYDVCGNDACRNKKMKDNSCPTCHETETKGSKYFKVVFMYKTEKKEDQKITLFKNTVANILKIEVFYNLKQELIQSLIEKLTIKCIASISANNALYNIK
ncbi:unnamed protein product [Mytilus coruscus]|uniref:DUF6570 domain-containing protein n=1 Tax=Mytilus coruscus TaxID=42192 RepID=A0A6J8DEB4_MYTCO|nr:unnamed protein product [Mytilus coruscus]